MFHYCADRSTLKADKQKTPTSLRRSGVFVRTNPQLTLFHHADCAFTNRHQILTVTNFEIAVRSPETKQQFESFYLA
jgi:hypothetical protein